DRRDPPGRRWHPIGAVTGTGDPQPLPGRHRPRRHAARAAGAAGRARPAVALARYRRSTAGGADASRALRRRCSSAVHSTRPNTASSRIAWVAAAPSRMTTAAAASVGPDSGVLDVARNTTRTSGRPSAAANPNTPATASTERTTFPARTPALAIAATTDNISQ